MKEMAGAHQAMQVVVKRGGQLLHFAVTPVWAGWARRKRAGCRSRCR